MDVIGFLDLSGMAYLSTQALSVVVAMALVADRFVTVALWLSYRTFAMAQSSVPEAVTKRADRFRKSGGKVGLSLFLILLLLAMSSGLAWHLVMPTLDDPLPANWR